MRSTTRTCETIKAFDISTIEQFNTKFEAWVDEGGPVTDLTWDLVDVDERPGLLVDSRAYVEGRQEATETFSEGLRLFPFESAEQFNRDVREWQPKSCRFLCRDLIAVDDATALLVHYRLED